VLRDAQETNQAQFAKGELSAHVVEMTPDRHNSAQARLIWNGPRTWWEYSVSHQHRETGAAITDQEGVQMIETPEELIWYSPAANGLQRVLDKSSNYYRELALRPDQAWFTFERDSATPWSAIFETSLAEASVERIVITQEEDLIHFDRVYTFGNTARNTVSLSQGGNVVAYEWEAVPNPPGGWPYARTGTYEWVPFGNGGWRLASLRYKHYLPGQQDDPVYSYEMTVDEFDPEPKIAADRFTLESLNVADGTAVHETGPRGRTYRYGAPNADLTQDALDRLVETLREGFAAPESEAAP
jgi:hypothetical protein